jgi:hypothetical protein
MKATVQTVEVTNLPAGVANADIAASPLIGQLLTREDGETRFVYLGNNDDGDDDAEVLANTPDEAIPFILIQIGFHQIIDGKQLAGATIRVLKDLPSIDVKDAA